VEHGQQLWLRPVVEFTISVLDRGKPLWSLRPIGIADNLRERLLISVVQSKLQAYHLLAIRHIGSTSPIRRLDRVAVLGSLWGVENR
jgi:ABC-type Fe3+-citrate transport system substrate-binding protein